MRAATSMFLTSLANSLPRLASMTAFLCFVVAHLECPAISLLPTLPPTDGGLPSHPSPGGGPLPGRGDADAARALEGQLRTTGAVREPIRRRSAVIASSSSRSRRRVFDVGFPNSTL